MEYKHRYGKLNPSVRTWGTGLLLYPGSRSEEKVASGILGHGCMGAFFSFVIYFQGQTMYDLLVMPVLDLCNGVAPLALWTIGPLVALVGTFAVIGVMVKNMVFTVRDEGGMKAWL